MSQSHKRSFPALILVFISILGVIDVPQFFGGVHADSLSTPIVYVSPSQVALSPQNSKVKFNVSVSNMPPFGGWDIYIAVGDNTILNPVSITLAETFGGTVTEIEHCINAVGSGCQGNAKDGAGIAHSVVYGSNSDTGNVTLFTVTYDSPSNNPNAYTFLSIPSPLVTDINGTEITVSASGATYGNSASAPQAVFTWTPISPYKDQVVTYNASQSYDPSGGRIVHYFWACDFCGGVAGDHPVVFVPVKASTNYTVTLTVVNDRGLRSNPTSHTIHAYQRIFVDLSIYGLVLSQYYQVLPGTIIQIQPSVTNIGSAPVQSFNVTIGIDNRPVASEAYNYSKNGNFTSGQQASLGSYKWDTSGVAPGTYTVSATLSKLQGDNNTRDKYIAIDVNIIEPRAGASLSLIPFTAAQFSAIVVAALIAIGAGFYILGRRRDKRRRLLQEAL